MERDEYDSHALHALVQHKTTGLAVACTRLITPGPSNSATPLPLERYCKDSLNIDYLNTLKLPRRKICEASRLSVSKSFRRRHGRDGKPEPHYGYPESLELSEPEQRTFPFISISISLATTALTELTGRPYMFAMMEPFLPRLLQRVGYSFRQVGEMTDYHGQRAAYLQESGAVLQNLKAELRELYCEIRKSLREFG